jgi:hypothetical protein
MNREEAALFVATLAALDQAENSGSANVGFIENAEPTTATCTVE